MLCRLALMVQAAVLDGLFLDLFSPFDDGGVTPVVSVGGCDVTKGRRHGCARQSGRGWERDAG